MRYYPIILIIDCLEYIIKAQVGYIYVMSGERKSVTIRRRGFFETLNYTLFPESPDFGNLESYMNRRDAWRQEARDAVAALKEAEKDPQIGPYIHAYVSRYGYPSPSASDVFSVTTQCHDILRSAERAAKHDARVAASIKSLRKFVDKTRRALAAIDAEIDEVDRDDRGGSKVIIKYSGRRGGARQLGPGAARQLGPGKPGSKKNT